MTYFVSIGGFQDIQFKMCLRHQMERAVGKRNSCLHRENWAKDLRIRKAGAKPVCKISQDELRELKEQGTKRDFWTYLHLRGKKRYPQKRML